MASWSCIILLMAVGVLFVSSVHCSSFCFTRTADDCDACEVSFGAALVMGDLCYATGGAIAAPGEFASTSNLYLFSSFSISNNTNAQPTLQVFADGDCASPILSYPLTASYVTYGYLSVASMLTSNYDGASPFLKVLTC